MRGFDDDVWTTHCLEIITRGVTANVRPYTGTEKTGQRCRNKERGDGQGKTHTQLCLLKNFTNISMFVMSIAV